jgi:hypothetical protein
VHRDEEHEAENSRGFRSALLLVRQGGPTIAEQSMIIDVIKTGAPGIWGMPHSFSGI